MRTGREKLHAHAVEALLDALRHAGLTASPTEHADIALRGPDQLSKEARDLLRTTDWGYLDRRRSRPTGALIVAFESGWSELDAEGVTNMAV